MRIALVTTHNTNNYGAICQTFATQVVLSRFGQVEIVDYANRHISRSLDLIRLKLSPHGILGAGKDLFRLLPRRRVISKFRKFSNDRMRLTRTYSRDELERPLSTEYDCYVAGSDQIWNPDCISADGSLDPVYFLSFAHKDAKKVAYASSFGSYSFSKQEELQIKKYLADFSMISVREAGAKVLLEEILNREVHHVLDPTLLLSKEEWLESAGLAAQPSSAEKYILIYTVPKTIPIRPFAAFFSRALGLQVIVIEQGLSARADAYRHIKDAGPLDFIRLFSEASFVITDSFHGVCFSVNFGIPFVAVSPGKYANRISSLLQLVGLQDRMIESMAECENFHVEIDFEAAHEKLLAARRSSLELLSAHIEA